MTQPGPARDVLDVYPLTPMQHGMLIETLRSDTPVYLQQYHLEVAGVAEAEQLRVGLAGLIARHDALRSGLVWDVGERPLHVIRGNVSPLLTAEDLRGSDERAIAERVAALLDEERKTPFNLRRPPLLRVRAVRAGDRLWHLVLTYHHVVIDGWSVPLLISELTELLSCAVDGSPPALSEPRPFREFVTWQQGQANAEDDRRHFTELLGDVAEATPLGHGLPGSPHQPSTGRPASRVVVTRPAPADRHPVPGAARLGVLPSTIVNAAWALLLARWADLDDVTFGMVVSGRPAELDGATERVGMFVNTVVLRVPVPLDAQLGDWLKDVRERVGEAHLRSQASLAAAQECSAIPSGSPLVKSVVAFQNYWESEQDEAHSGQVRVRVRGRSERNDLPISLSVAIPDEGVWVRLDHNVAEVTHQDAVSAAGRFAWLIESIANAQPETRLGDLPIDPPAPAADGGSGGFAVRQPWQRMIGQIRSHALGRPAAAVADEVCATNARALWREAERIARDLPGHPAIVAEGVDMLAAVLGAVLAGEHPFIADPSIEQAELLSLLAAHDAEVMLASPGEFTVPGGAVVREIFARDANGSSEGDRGHPAAQERPAVSPPAGETDPRLDRLAGLAVRVAEELSLTHHDWVSIVAPSSPACAAAALAALSAGARIDLRRPFDPAPAGTTVLMAPPAIARSLLDTCDPQARIVFVGDVPPRRLLAQVLASGRSAWRLCAAAQAIVPLRSPGQSASLGQPPDSVVVGRHGWPVPHGNPGELRFSTPGQAPRASGVRVRRLADGTLQQIGRTCSDESALTEEIISADQEVLDVAVADCPAGRHAWIVAEPGAAAGPLAERLDEALPRQLRPAGYRFVAALPVGPDGLVAREALTTGSPAPHSAGAWRQDHSADSAAAARLGAHSRLSSLRERLAAAAAQPVPVRHAVRDEPPASAQAEQWRVLAVAPLRARAQVVVQDQVASTLPAVVPGVDVTRLADGGHRVTAMGDVLDAESLGLLTHTGAGATSDGLTYDDYAAWQRSPLRGHDVAGQAERWRAVLAGQPVTGRLALDGGPGYTARQDNGTLNGARRTLETTRHVRATKDPAAWCAALACALWALSGDDDVVIGVVLRPSVPPALAGVPGAYARMLPVRVHVDPSAGFGRISAEVGASITAAKRDGDVSWETLARLLPESPRLNLAVHDIPGALAAHASGDLAIDVSPAEAESAVTVTALHDVRTVHPRTVARLLDLAAAVLNIGMAAPDRAIDLADLLGEEDRATLLRLGAGPVSPEPAVDLTRGAPGWNLDATVSGAIRARALAQPGAVAVDFRGELTTYRHLMRLADEMAARIRALGVRADDLVAVCLPRVPAMIWAPLGVLIAGAGYVGLDASYPDDRLRTILADAHARAVVTTGDLAHRFADVGPVLCVDEHDLDTAKPWLADAMPADGARPDSTCCVIYTSGSTGKPKGVPLDHRAVAGFNRLIADAYHLDATSRVVSFAQLVFDASIFDLWTTLSIGGVVVLAGDEERASVEALQRLLAERRVTAGEIPPSLMPLLNPQDLPDLRLVSVGGDPPAGRLVDTWATPQREFWNGYGPTESTVAVTLMDCRPPSGGRVPPIGLPTPDHRVYVLDPQQRLLPPGAPGELCVAGPGLSRGYLGRPGETANVFVPDPFSGLAGRRMYRTGDLVRWTPDNVLEFLGRVDRQVKIRGFRVEPGEVESVIGASPAVRQVLVEPWDDADGTRHLVAYVIPADPDHAPALPEIRAAGAATLPPYMLPTRLVILDRLPRTVGGKVDRKALPPPTEPVSAAGTLDQPMTPIEHAIASEVIGPLLKVADIGPDDGFFELGGNSLQATQITARVRDQFGVEIGLLDFFTAPTVRHLAELIERGRGAAVAARLGASTDDGVHDASPMIDGAVLPASYPQAALAQACRAGGDRPGYHACLALRLKGDMNIAAMRAAFDWMLRRHAPLRTVFAFDGPDIHQRVTAASECDFTLVEVPGADADARYQAVRTLIREENERPFDLSAGPLMRVRVYQLGTEDHVLQWTIHHVATDGWSIGVQFHEIGAAYQAYADGAEPDLPPLPTDYGDFVAWHRGYVASPDFREDLAWWRQRFDGLVSPSLPVASAPLASAPGPAQAPQFHDGWLNLRLPTQTARDVRTLARRADATLYMVLLAAYALVLGETQGREEVLVLSPYALRVKSEWESLVGWFVNRVPVRVSLTGDPAFEDLLIEVRAEAMSAFAHGRPPFELLRSELGLSSDLLTAQLNVQNAPTRDLGFEDFDISNAPDDSGRDFSPILEVYSPLRSPFQLSLALRERGADVVAGALEFNAAVMSDREAASFANAFLAVLGRASINPAIPVSALRSLIRDSYSEM